MTDDPNKRGKAQRTETIAPQVQPQPQPQPRPDGEEGRLRRIAEAAYYNSERRGFAPGYELEDWLAAEAQINTTPPAQR